MAQFGECENILIEYFDIITPPTIHRICIHFISCLYGTNSCLINGFLSNN